MWAHDGRRAQSVTSTPDSCSSRNAARRSACSPIAVRIAGDAAPQSSTETADRSSGPAGAGDLAVDEDAENGRVHDDPGVAVQLLGPQSRVEHLASRHGDRHAADRRTGG
jgi:hypothetical protein